MEENKLEQYVLMCEKAKEIQKQWHRKIGDLYCEHNTIMMSIAAGRESDGTISYSSAKVKFTEYCPKKAVWLPREEDLWEMLSATHTLGAKISMFHKFYDPEFYCPGEDNSLETSPCKKCAEIGRHRRTTFTTMKQFLLAFVIKELWNKEWDGQEWKK